MGFMRCYFCGILSCLLYREISLSSGDDLLQRPGAVTVALGLDSDSMQHRQPGVAERGVFGRDDIVAEFQAGTATGEDGGTIAQLVACADVATVGEGDVVEETRTVGFLGRFEFVEESREQFALGDVAALRGVGFSPSVV